MKPSVQKKLGKAKDKRASLQAMQYRNSVKEQLRNERLHILRQPTRTVGMRIENLLDQLEAGRLTEEELAKETGMNYYEAVGAWYRYVVAYEHSWLRTMVPFLLSKEEYNAIVGGGNCREL